MRKLTTAAGVLALMTGAALAQEKIVVGLPPAIDLLPVVVAADMGCFSDKGMDVEPQVIPIATNIPPALLAGSLQIGMTAATIQLPAVENGLPLVAIAGSADMIPGKDNISLVMATGTEVTSAEDLRGKKIGVPGIMSVGDLIFRKWLQNEGVDPSEVTFIEAPFPRMIEMTKSGAVDGVLAAEPIRSALVGTGTGTIAQIPYYSSVTGQVPLVYWMATKEWADGHKDEIASFRECLDMAAAWIPDHPEETQAAMEKTFGFKTDKTMEWTSDIQASGLQVYADIAKEFGLIRTDIDVNTLVAE